MAEAAMKVGLVTVTFNSADVIEPFLRDTLAQTQTDFILYVVDNASTDDTLQRLRKYSDPQIRVIANAKNVGVAEGNNQGTRAALADGCDAVLLINNDTEFETALIEKMGRELQGSGAGMVVPKILFYDPPDMIWCAGGSFNRLRGYSVIHDGERQKDTGQFNVARDIEYAPTCCMLVHRSVFDRIGLMDARYFAYFDDADFCMRAHRHNIRMRYLPDAVLRHKVSSLTGGGTSPFVGYHFTRNRFIFLRKHIGAVKVFLFAPLYELYLVARLLLGRDSLTLAARKQKGFWDGLREPVL